MNPLVGKLVRFLIVGVFCAAIFFAINYYLLKVAGSPLIVALVVAYSSCFFIGYLLQRNFSFRSTGRHRRSLPRYLILHGVGLLFVYLTTSWLQSVVLLSDVGAPLVATGLAGAASFVISLTWVFAPSPGETGYPGSS